ncbi:hypothetical protein [Saccharothrix yanglingensis]|uniref:hypothetical protein n=1 Tax=Saccharothrix yanglingensis TaxID=659496 RepID=UPI0027D26765|nr:hypothetical protein [Saccharothrix yanglingensis]
MRFCSRNGHRRSPASVRLDPATAEQVRLSALLEVVAAAVALQDGADEVILGCAQPGETPCEVARHGRVVAGQYSRLSGWAADLVGSGDRSVELLRYHLTMLDTALKLAFPRYRSDRLERHRLSLTGLGPPARELRELEEGLRARIARLGG